MRFGLRQIIFFVLLLAVPVGAFFFVFKPRNEQIGDARREIQVKQAKLSQLEKATRDIDDLGLEIDQLTQAIEIFEQKLPAEREVEVVLKQVWELAARHGLTPKSIRTDKPVIGADYAELPLKMVIVGDFDGYYRFLFDLTKLKRITRMPKMNLKKLGNEEGQMQADILMSIFYESPRGGRSSRTDTGGPS